MDIPAVQYVTSDGFSVAYTVIGEGIPYVFMPPPMSHIQLAWDNSNYRPWLDGLVSHCQLIQYDSRGQGMSSRGLPAGYALDDLNRDLEAVVRHLKLSQFVLMGSHISAHAAVRFAVEHPEQVRALVLAPCGVSGGLWPMINATELARENWEFFLAFYVMNLAASTAPGAAPSTDRGPREIETIRQSVTQRDWDTMAQVWSTSNIEGDLARLVTPTLALHPRNYLNVPSEQSVYLASRILNAQMTLIEGNTALGDATSGCAAIERFLKDVEQRVPAQVPRQASDLSAREVEVLRLIAAGRSNQQIAHELVISINTVLRHVTNIFTKTGSANRTEAATYAIRNGMV